MKNNRNIIVGLGIVISFALLIISVTLYFNIQHDQRQQNRLDYDTMDSMTKDEIIDYMSSRQSSKPIETFYLLPFAAFIGLIIGTLVFYIMSDKVVKREKSLAKNTKIILNFLSGQERKVIETLLENNGRVQQYELSHLPNLNKLKTHRILVNLEEKGIIHKEKIGKVNKIVLNKELYDTLKE